MERIKEGFGERMYKYQITNLEKLMKNMGGSNIGRPDMSKVFRDAWGRQFWYSPVMLIRLFKNVDSLQEHTDQEKEQWADNANKVGKTFEEALSRCGNYMPMPTIDEVKAYVKSHKSGMSSDGCIWAFSKNGPFVNARHLLDIMQVFPDVRFAKPGDSISAIYFHSEDGDGVLLPIRPQFAMSRDYGITQEAIDKDEEGAW